MRVIPAVGLIGCSALAFTPPSSSALAGALVVFIGAVIYAVRRGSAPRGSAGHRRVGLPHNPDG